MCSSASAQNSPADENALRPTRVTEEERQQLNYRPIDDVRIFRGLEPPAQGDPEERRDRF